MISHTQDWTPQDAAAMDAAWQEAEAFRAEWPSATLSGTWREPAPFRPGYLRVTLQEEV